MGKWGFIILIPLIVMIMFVSGCSESKSNTTSYINITANLLSIKNPAKTN